MRELSNVVLLVAFVSSVTHQCRDSFQMRSVYIYTSFEMQIFVFIKFIFNIKNIHFSD